MTNWVTLKADDLINYGDRFVCAKDSELDHVITDCWIGNRVDSVGRDCDHIERQVRVMAAGEVVQAGDYLTGGPVPSTRVGAAVRQPGQYTRQVRMESLTQRYLDWNESKQGAEYHAWHGVDGRYLNWRPTGEPFNNVRLEESSRYRVVWPPPPIDTTRREQQAGKAARLHVANPQTAIDSQVDELRALMATLNTAIGTMRAVHNRVGRSVDTIQRAATYVQDPNHDHTE